MPTFVRTCIDHVENTSGCLGKRAASPSFLLAVLTRFCPSPPAGLCVDGLYRVSGNLAVIQKLRYAVDRGQFPFPGRSLNSRLLVLTDALVSR